MHEFLNEKQQQQHRELKHLIKKGKKRKIFFGLLLVVAPYIVIIIIRNSSSLFLNFVSLFRWNYTAKQFTESYQQYNCTQRRIITTTKNTMKWRTKNQLKMKKRNRNLNLERVLVIKWNVKCERIEICNCSYFYSFRNKKICFFLLAFDALGLSLTYFQKRFIVSLCVCVAFSALCLMFFGIRCFFTVSLLLVSLFADYFYAHICFELIWKQQKCFIRLKACLFRYRFVGLNNRLKFTHKKKMNLLSTPVPLLVSWHKHIIKRCTANMLQLNLNFVFVELNMKWCVLYNTLQSHSSQLFSMKCRKYFLNKTFNVYYATLYYYHRVC